MAPLLAAPAPDRAFERLYEKYAREVYRYAIAVLRNPADAEDVTQTTFLNAYRSYVGGARPEKPKHWLIAIAHNVCRQRFRQSQRRPHEVEFQEEIAEAAVPDEHYSAGDIRRALSQLSFNQRSALVMRELQDRTYADIAEILELSVSAVETLLFRARRALREQLEGTLTCDQAELALSKKLDGVLSRADKSELRAHLRACATCATAARSQRAQKPAWKAIGAIPLPASLASFFGGGSAAVGTGVAVKIAVVAVAGLAAVGGTYEIVGKDAFIRPAGGARVAKVERAPAPVPVPLQKVVLPGAPVSPAPVRRTEKPAAKRQAAPSKPAAPASAKPGAPAAPAVAPEVTPSSAPAAPVEETDGSGQGGSAGPPGGEKEKDKQRGKSGSAAGAKEQHGRSDANRVARSKKQKEKKGKAESRGENGRGGAGRPAASERAGGNNAKKPKHGQGGQANTTPVPAAAGGESDHGADAGKDKEQADEPGKAEPEHGNPNEQGGADNKPDKENPGQDKEKSDKK